MATNKSVVRSSDNEERERCRVHAPNSACEKLLHNLATNPRVSDSMKLIPLLCPTCAQKLTELLTTIGLGAKRYEESDATAEMRLKAGAPAKWDYDGLKTP